MSLLDLLALLPILILVFAGTTILMVWSLVQRTSSAYCRWYSNGFTGRTRGRDGGATCL